MSPHPRSIADVAAEHTIPPAQGEDQPVDSVNFRTEKGKIIPPALARHLRQQTPTATGGGVIHAYEGGVYAPGEAVLAERVHAIGGDDWTRHMAGEVLGAIRAGSPVLDEHPPLDKINVRNGIYDLTSGALVTHDPAVLFPIQLPVTFDPDASCPAIARFLGDTLDDPTALLFLELAGYLLTGDNRMQRAFLFKGPKGNGKSTALDVLTALLGRQNVSHVALQQLDEHRFAVAQLYGRLANMHADLPGRAVKGTSTFKCITGGDAVMAEHKGRDPFTFTPYARFVFSANETPPTHDGSEAYFDRWTILPFTRTFRGVAGEDRNLRAKLTTPGELSGLLNLALSTIPKVRADGFTIGDAVRAEHEQFRLDSDPVSAFLDECCQVVADARTARSAVYRAYSEWCRDTGRSALAAQRFTARVRDRYGAAVTETTYSGTRQWAGLRLHGGA